MTAPLMPVAALLVLLTMLVGGYGGFWLLAADTAEDALTRWAEARRAQGYEVYWRETVTTGFPGEMTLTVHEPQVRFPEAEGGGGWAAPVLHLSARPWAPRTFTVTAPGEHVTNFVAGGRIYQTRGSAGEAVATVEVDSAGAVEAAALRVRALEITGLSPRGALRLASLDAAMEYNPGGDASLFERTEARDTGIHGALDIALDDLRLPGGLAAPIGNGLDTLRLQAVMQGEMPPGPDLQARLRSWQEAGGIVEIDRFVVVSDPLRLSAAGTATLDDRLQPQMALTAQIRGFFEALDRLENHGALRPRDVSIAKVVLGVVARRPPDGGPAALELPVTVQDSTLYLGPVALAKLPLLHWGGDRPPGPAQVTPGMEIGRDGSIIRPE